MGCMGGISTGYASSKFMTINLASMYFHALGYISYGALLPQITKLALLCVGAPPLVGYG